MIEWDFWDRVLASVADVGRGPAEEFAQRFPRVLPPGMQVLTAVDFHLSSEQREVRLTVTMASAGRLQAMTGSPVDAATHQGMAEEVAVTLAYAALLLLDPAVYRDAEVSVVHEHSGAGDEPLAFVADDRGDLANLEPPSEGMSRFEQVGGIAVPWVTQADRLRELQEKVKARHVIEDSAAPSGTHERVRRFQPQHSEERLARIAELRARQASGEREAPTSEAAREAPAPLTTHERVRRFQPQHSEERLARIAELRARQVSRDRQEPTPALKAVASAPTPLDPYSLDPREFELLVKRLLEAMGLTAKETPYSKDDGVDVIAEDRRPFRRGRVVVQAKRYAGSVGVTTVRELNGVLPLHRAQRGIVVTTGAFTREAVTTAGMLGIELIDGVELRSALAEHLPG